MNKIKSAYIHIPFCRQKCRYCSFVSFAQTEKKDIYLEALKKEIKARYNGETLQTLYFGGGTPSLLSSQEFEAVISLFKINKTTEITAELNPEKLSEEYLKELKAAGINRLSIGCQTFDEKILNAIGRKHTPKDVEFAVKTAQDNGFENISLDFIYGLPEQTLESFTDDLSLAQSLDIQHISLYGLKIEQGCWFYENQPSNIADEDLQAEMYLAAIEVLNDFEHYEISNFAKPSFRSRHNLNYWDNENYYGFGAASHGYEGNTRYSHPSSLTKYISCPCEFETKTELSTQEQLEEEIFLGFRKMDGIDIKKINEKFSIDFDKKYRNILDKYLKSRHLLKTQIGYRLSNEGILVSNVILSEFIE